MPFAKQTKKDESKPAEKPADAKKPGGKLDFSIVLIPLIIVVVGLFLFGFVKSRMNGGDVLKAKTAELSSAENLPHAAQEIVHTAEQAVVEPVKAAVETVKSFYFGMED